MMTIIQPTRGAVAVVVVACLAAPTCAEVIAYDSLPGSSRNFVSYLGGEVADDTTLTPGAGLMITSASLHIRNPESSRVYDGPFAVSIYADGGGRPGSLLTTQSIHLSLPRLAEKTLRVDLPPALAPSAHIWTAYTALFQYGSIAIEYGKLPVVGSSTHKLQARSGGVGTWSQIEFDGAAMQVTTVPSPGASVIVFSALAFPGWSRRR